VQKAYLTILSPLILAANLVLLLRSEVVGDVESLSNFLRRLALDHVRNRLASKVQKWLDVHVVGGEDDFEKHLLVELHVRLVPLLDVGGLASIGGIVFRSRCIVSVVFTPFDDLSEDDLVDVYHRNGNGALFNSPEIVDCVLDEFGLLGNVDVDGNEDFVIGSEDNLGGLFSHLGCWFSYYEWC
jgi:hypothetical protein